MYTKLDMAVSFGLVDFMWALLQTFLLVRWRRVSSWLIGILFGWALAMTVCGAVACLTPADWRMTLNEWFFVPMGTHIIWHLMVVVPWVLALFGILVIDLGLGLRLKKTQVPLKTVKADEPVVTRRQFLVRAGVLAAPAGALALGVYGAGTNLDLRVRRLEVPIADLPDDFAGFTIAHVSDLHSGIFCGPKRLKIVSDAVNDLKADLVAVTGDLINDNAVELPNAMSAIGCLRSKLGTLVCQGNHDLNVGVDLIRTECQRHGLEFLYSTTKLISVGNGRLVMAGLPWMQLGTDELVAGLFPERKEGDVQLLLAHHPNLFDYADSVDLVLSGHTHGGQIMFGDVGIGSLAFKYWSGLYRGERNALVVSNGCGDWFPCRIGAPAEVALLTLVKA